MATSTTQRIDRYLKTYSGRDLLKKHTFLEVGSWAIYGEDPNCDFGGHHHEPFLGVFHGTLEDAIAHAVDLSGFWQWGGGGRIKATHIASTTNDAKAVADFVKVGAALEKLTDEEIELLGLKDFVYKVKK